MTSTWAATTARNAGCSARAQQFKSTYNALCRDPNCKVGIFILVADFSAQCLKNNGESVSFPAELWAVKGEAPHIAKMDKLPKMDCKGTQFFGNTIYMRIFFRLFTAF